LSEKGRGGGKEGVEWVLSYRRASWDGESQCWWMGSARQVGGTCDLAGSTTPREWSFAPDIELYSCDPGVVGQLEYGVLPARTGPEPDVGRAVPRLAPARWGEHKGSAPAFSPPGPDLRPSKSAI
jgi:hypothetical protein